MTDEMTILEARERLEELGCDETFIEITLDEIRDGESVFVSVPGRGTFEYKHE